MSTMSQRSQLTDSEAWRVVGRLEGGQTQAEVAQSIGESQSVISRIWNRFWRLEVQAEYQDKTVRNRLHGVGLYARRPMVRVRLTARHRRDRREWATEHVNWRRNEWCNVFFLTSPVFLFIRIIGVFSSGRIVAVGIILRWCTKVSDLAVGVCWCMVASPLTDAHTDLYIIRNEPLTARRYRDEILRPIVAPYAAAIGDDFILMDDALGRRVAGRQPPPQTLQELERALLEEWDRIPQLVINSHIDSMPQRCSTLLDVRGNHTPYK
ncbi:transposable element Tcb2 transposase [Trichonephila clavipes]|nr:transposable element Tcb2 transposase [Trichonephila clavipes]